MIIKWTLQEFRIYVNKVHVIVLCANFYPKFYNIEFHFIYFVTNNSVVATMVLQGSSSSYKGF